MRHVMRRVQFSKSGHPRLVRLRLLPFEAAVAALAMFQAVFYFTGVGPEINIIPPWAGTVIMASYGLAGFGILVGLSWGRGDIEASGLALLGATVVARSLLLAAQMGWSEDSAVTLFFAAIVAFACYTRLRVLLPGGAERVLGPRVEEV